VTIILKGTESFRYQLMNRTERYAELIRIRAKEVDVRRAYTVLIVFYIIQYLTSKIDRIMRAARAMLRFWTRLGLQSTGS
jgi:hypothetical protein